MASNNSLPKEPILVNESNVPNKRFTRIIPFAFIMYLIAYLDRNNIGYAFPGMQKSLHISPTIAGLAGGIFFLGYFLLQIPAGYISKKYGTRKLIFYSQIAWGILAVASAFVHNGTQLLILRFLLGMAESALFPAVLILVTEWFPNKERGRANSLWQLGSVVAGLIIGPICGYILTITTWKWLFILEGIPAIIWAFVWLALVPDKPENAKFLSEEERKYLNDSFEEDKKNIKPTSSNWKQVLSSPIVWALIIADFLLNMGAYGIGLWMPTVIKNLTNAGFGAVGIITAVITLCQVIAMYLIPRHSDNTGERKYHASFSIILGGIMLFLSTAVGHHVYLSLIFLMLMGVVGGFLPLFWTFPPMFISESELGYTMGLINGLGNLGGFFGPFIVGYFMTLTGSTNAGLVFCSASWVLCGVIVLFLKIGRVRKAKTVN